MLSHVVRQVCEDQSPLLGLVDRRTVYLDVVASPVYVVLLPQVVDHLGGRHDSAVANVEVEESQKIVHVVSLHEIRSLQRKVEPTGHSDRFVTANVWAFFWEVFLNLHVDLVSVRVEVEHDRLLEESVLVVNPGGDFVQVLVDRLLKVQAIALNAVDVCLDVRERLHPLLELPARPLLLNTDCCSGVDDDVDWQLGTGLSPFVCLVRVLDGSDRGHSHEQSLEEENHLLVFVNVDLTVVVEYVEADGDDDVEMLRLEDQEVFVLILKHELAEEWILLLLLKICLQLLQICMTTIRKDPQLSIGPLFSLWRTEDEITQRERRI